MKLVALLQQIDIESPTENCYIYNNMFDCVDHLSKFGEVKIIKEPSSYDKDKFGKIILRNPNNKTIDYYFTIFYGKEE